MSREAWLAERRTGIGGSDVAPIIGISPFRSALEVYLEKRGDLGEPPLNDAMHWGNLLEPVVRQEYADRTGKAVMMPAGMIRHPKHEFMLANLDGYVDGDRLFEAKTARTSIGWGEPGTDEVPQGYLFQVQHYMAVTGYPLTDIAVLIGGSDFRIYTIEADPELHGLLIDAEADFWRRVQEEDAPEPVSLSDAEALWGRFSTSKKVVATADVEAAVMEMRTIKAAISDLEARFDEKKLAVLCAMQDADTLVDLQGRELVTWRAGKPPVRFDSKALKGANPEIYEQFATEGEATRRFLIKQEKN